MTTCKRGYAAGLHQHSKTIANMCELEVPWYRMLKEHADLNYQHFITELRRLIVRRNQRTDRLDTLFAELVANTSNEDEAPEVDPERWAELLERDGQLGEARSTWIKEVLQLLGEDDMKSRSWEPLTPGVGDMTLSDAAPDQSLADVDLDALDGELPDTGSANRTRHQAESLDWDSVIVDLGPEADQDDGDAPGFVWPEGLKGSNSELSALDALAADLEERDDPWGRLEIKDLRQEGAPTPLQPTSVSTADGASPSLDEADNLPAGPPPIPVRIPDLSRPEDERSVDELFDKWLAQPKAGPSELASSTGARSPSVPPGSPIAVKLAMRVGDSLYTGFSTSIGVETLSLTSEHPLTAGDLLHLFLELPNGAQIGANTVVASAHATDGTGGPFAATVRYLDLTDEARSLIQALGSTGAPNAV